MLKNILRVADEDSGNAAVDWVVLAAGIVSLGMAVTLTATHHANAASPNETAPVTRASNAF
ncbi:hypothetical protein [Profundibacter sp.]